MTTSPDPLDISDPLKYRFDLDRRGFLRLVGAGVAVAVASAPADGQANATQADAAIPRVVGAWIHVAQDGTITGYTGKTEVGQNIRTSLSQAVSEELLVPMSSVRLLMADTARVPFDGGTTGSRTTPQMGLQLRKAAAAARTQLVGIAADRWRLPAADLRAGDGRVSHPSTGRSASYGELVGTRVSLTVIDDDEPLTPPSEWRVLGRAERKINGIEFVTGRHTFTSDMLRPSMLHGRVKRPPSQGATLASVTTTGAAELPGVRIVRDGDFLGVVASSLDDADRAIDALKVSWTETRGPDSDTVFEYFRTVRATETTAGRTLLPPRIVGSTREAFSTTALTLRASYTCAYIAHAPLEPRVAIAEWAQGELTVWTGTQRPFQVRDELAAAFALSPERVRVVVADTGSAYGGKHTGEAAVEAARLARAAGRPVKVTWTREEEFSAGYFRPAGVIDIRSGTGADGRIQAFEYDSYNAGPAALYPSYDFPNQRIEMHPTVSPLRVGSYRGLAATANHFARETHLDEIALALNLDPLEVRLRNLSDARQRAVLMAVVDRAGWSSRRHTGPFLGLACGVEKGSYVATVAEVTIGAAGKPRVTRLTTAFECGAIVNPEGLRNQVDGALLQGLGGALFEQIRFDAGRVLNPRFSAYRVPRFNDIPSLDTVLLDRRDLPSAGAGETPIVAVAPAIGNALCAATGLRLRRLPLDPDRDGTPSARR